MNGNAEQARKLLIKDEKYLTDKAKFIRKSIKGHVKMKTMKDLKHNLSKLVQKRARSADNAGPAKKKQ